MQGICSKHEKVTGYKPGPQPGTFDFRVELIPLPAPTPEKFQRKARLRRLKQAYWQDRMSCADYVKARERVEADYKTRG